MHLDKRLVRHFPLRPCLGAKLVAGSKTKVKFWITFRSCLVAWC